MSRPRTLLIDEQGLTVHDRQAGQWRKGEHFAQTSDGLTRFASYLQQHRRQRFRLLVDLAPEEIVIDSIPLLRGRDRQALIARKLEQYFAGQTLRCASPLAPDKRMPGRERLRLAAFTHGAKLNHWLSPITSANSRLSGIYSCTQVVGTALPQLGKTPADSLLFVQTRQSLRQFFLHNGQTELARSVPVDSENPQQISQEASRLQHYLCNQHLLARDQHLPVFIVGGAAGKHDTGDRLTFHDCPEISDPQALFLTALASHTPATQFAPAALLLADQQARRHLAVTIFTGLFSLTGLALATVNYQEAESLQQTSAQHLALLNAQPATSEPTISDDGPRPSIATLRHLDERYQTLRHEQQQPRAALTEQSRVLEQHPAVQLATLVWQSHAGQDSLMLGGHLDGKPQENEERLTNFVASLRVDRNRPVKLRPPAEASDAQGIWRGSHEDAAVTRRQSFHIDIGSRP